MLKFIRLVSPYEISIGFKILLCKGFFKPHKALKKIMDGFGWKWM